MDSLGLPREEASLAEVGSDHGEGALMEREDDWPYQEEGHGDRDCSGSGFLSEKKPQYWITWLFVKSQGAGGCLQMSVVRGREAMMPRMALSRASRSLGPEGSSTL